MALANAEEDAFLNGDGVGKPTGIFNKKDGGTFLKETTGIKTDDLIDLVHALRRPYRKNASFIMNDKTVASIRKLKDNNGAYVWQPSYQDDEPNRILGYPVYTSAYAPENMVAFATSFFSIAKQMSVQGLHVWNVNGKNMTLTQVAQRANDYARAAVQIDKTNADKKAARVMASSRNHPEPKQSRTNNDEITANASGRSVSQPVISSTSIPSAQLNASTSQGFSMPSQQTLDTPSQASPSFNTSQTAGWGKYLDHAGLNGFSDITKNLGYVFAMLPDMLIGMFTGRTSSFTVGNNILPLAAIAAGMFTRNPLLRLMLMGFGGANLLNNAGHEVLEAHTPKAIPRNYKQYADEPLNPRLNNVYMRGRSLIADIDNRPVVINISDNVVDAYEKKAIPLNTLANAVLRKYDENSEKASNTYDRELSSLESQEQQRAYGIK